MRKADQWEVIPYPITAIQWRDGRVRLLAHTQSPPDGHMVACPPWTAVPDGGPPWPAELVWLIRALWHTDLLPAEVKRGDLP